MIRRFLNAKNGFQPNGFQLNGLTGLKKSKMYLTSQLDQSNEIFEFSRQKTLCCCSDIFLIRVSIAPELQVIYEAQT